MAGGAQDDEQRVGDRDPLPVDMHGVVDDRRRHLVAEDMRTLRGSLTRMSSSGADSAAKTQRSLEAGKPVETTPAAPPGLRGVIGLRRQRRRLVRRRQGLVFDLGGLALELARRGRLDQPAIRARAALVEELDEAVRKVDDQLDAAAEHARGGRKSRKRSAASRARLRCPVCDSPQDPVAVYCSACGERLPWPGHGSDEDAR